MSTIIRPDGSTLTLDATIEEIYDPNIRVTDHPLEDGGTVSDHAQILPKTLQLQGLMTESPQQNLGGPFGIQRILGARNFLQAAAGELLSVVTSRFGTLTNMMMTRYPHRINVKKNMPITLAFKEIRIATAALVIIPPEQPVDSESVGAPDGQDVGVQPTGDTAQDPAQEARDTSAARDILASIGVL